uniref:Mediator complex subunit 15 KIX domain-containing protein n=1 Tax=Lactuca sativa TaxID=4236 RepID=A0A9R1V4G0_LACSA|nr:hypothetical protein LSAT_V11C600305210 [Lactuca sativa]
MSVRLTIGCQIGDGYKYLSRMDTLKKHHPSWALEKPQEIKSIAQRLEEKIYTTTTSQSDYVRKISMKLLTMESRSANLVPNSLQCNSVSSSVNPSNPGSHGIHQVNNQGQQPLPIPVPSNHPQATQQILSQSIHSNIPSSGVQVSAGVSSALPPADTNQATTTTTTTTTTVSKLTTISISTSDTSNCKA